MKRKDTTEEGRESWKAESRREEKQQENTSWRKEGTQRKRKDTTQPWKEGPEQDKPQIEGDGAGNRARERRNCQGKERENHQWKGGDEVTNKETEN